MSGPTGSAAYQSAGPETGGRDDQYADISRGKDRDLADDLSDSSNQQMPYRAPPAQQTLMTDRFPTDCEYSNPFVAVAFLVQLLATLLWSVSSMLNVSEELQQGLRSYEGLVSSMFFCSFWAMVVAMVWLYVMSRMAYTFILISNVGQITLCLVAATLTLSNGYFLAGLAVLLVAGANSLWLFVARDRVTFASLLLEHSCRVVSMYSGVLVLVVGALLVQILYIVLFAFIAQDVYTARKSGIWMLLLFTIFFWTTQVVQNVVHTTVSGVMGTWYFMHSHSTEDPTVPCLKRALTTSLGSVCVASLGAAWVKILEVISRSSPPNTSTVVGQLLAHLSERVDYAMEYFNAYGLTHVAIYGKPYLYASSDTFQLIKQAGLGALINDSLINPLLLMISMVGGFIIGSMVALATMHVPTFLCAWMVSASVIGVMMSLVHSAVITLFVCFAEEPDTLRLTNPDLHQRITHVMEGLGDEEF